MAKRASDVQPLTPPPSPMSLDEFATACLDTVLARNRGDDQRREHGRAHRALYASTGDTREPREAPRSP